MELQQNSSSLVLQQLQTWAVEVETLIVSVVLSSPGRMKEFTNSRMDDSTSCSEERPANFYTNLVVRVPYLHAYFGKDLGFALRQSPLVTLLPGLVVLLLH